jgi:hypothetical protein
MNLYEDYVNTAIISRIYSVVYTDDMCTCHEDSYYGWTDGCYCNIPDIPRVVCTKIVVRVVGKPIRFKPEDCQYILSIWISHTVKNKITDYMFDDVDPKYEFTLVNTNDPADLDKNEYMDIIKQIYPNPIETGTINYDEHLEYNTFKAKVSIESYQKGFINLLEKIITSTPRLQPTECDHVKPKKKKSHRRR